MISSEGLRKISWILLVSRLCVLFDMWAVTGQKVEESVSVSIHFQVQSSIPFSDKCYRFCDAASFEWFRAFDPSCHRHDIMYCYECCLSISIHVGIFIHLTTLVVVVPLFDYFYGSQVIERLIETGDSEQIFQKAIQEQGRGQVYFVCLGSF